ncbi:hypothetical protein BHE74_00036488 [Ensete ventricosum]|nr:hypothetical protein BHE74_00036488 [Ensete ventricosum]
MEPSSPYQDLCWFKTITFFRACDASSDGHFLGASAPFLTTVSAHTSLTSSDDRVAKMAGGVEARAADPGRPLVLAALRIILRFTISAICVIGCVSDQLVVGGVESLYVVGCATALVLRASWSSLFLCSRMKKMATLSVILIEVPFLKLYKGDRQFAPCCDLLGLGDWSNLNSSKRVHNLASIRISEASNLASNKPSDVMTRRQQIDGFVAWWATMEATSKAIMGIAWEGGGMDDGYKGNKIATLIPDDRTPEGAL